MAERGTDEIVLVRGFQGEPAKLMFVEAGDRAFTVCSLDRSAIIGIHTSDVFEFDDDLYRQLLAAHSKEPGSAQLWDLWSKATRFDPDHLEATNAD